jgi:tetratricopeptide (TPR) repeat protein
MGCITKRVVSQYGTEKTFHLCPKCNVEVNALAVANAIDPFWRKIPSFFAYPFHPRPLMLMAALTIATLLFSFLGPFGAIFNLVAWGIVLKYSFVVLKNAAQGNLVPPKMSTETLSNDFHIVFKQGIIYFVIGIAFVFIVAKLGNIVGILFLVFALLSIPAMIIVLAVTDNLTHALNPMIFVQMAWRIGWGYLLMYFFILLLGVAPTFWGNHIIAHLPPSSHICLLFAAKCYYTLISYYLMGYVILQYHEDIGYDVAPDDVALEEKNTEDEGDNELLNKIQILTKEGRLEDAITLMQDNLLMAREDITVAESYFNLLKLTERFSEMVSHGKVYLDLLARTDRKADLCQVYSDCISKDPAFATTQGTLFKIASALNESGNPKAAIGVYNRFIKANGTSPLIPKAYFLAANIFNEKLANPKKAAGILKGLMKNFPNHEILPHVQQYLRQIQ